MPAQSNAITERLSTLRAQWTSFAGQPARRLLVWRAQPEEVPMIEAFVAAESAPECAETPDLFLRLGAPFVHARGYGLTLRDELTAQYEAARRELESDAIVADWRCPALRQADDDVTALVHALGSFHAQHAQDIDRLAVWIDPRHVHDAAELAAWLARVVTRSDARLCFFVVDLDEPELTALATRLPDAVQVVPCALDMAGAAVALADDADDGTPAPALRSALVGLQAAAAQGDLQSASQLADKACALALALGSPQLAGVAQITLAAAFTARERHADALRAYGEAERLGAASERDAGGADTSQARHIRLHARLGQGAVLIAHGAWGIAADVYLAAVAIAEASADTRSQLDCLRLASFCYERAEQFEKAWPCAMRAFAFGVAMSGDERAQSSFPYLCVSLLRLAERPEYAAHHAAITSHTRELLGADWRAKLTA